MSTFTSIVKQYPLPTFFVLACALSWWLLLIDSSALFPWGVGFAAIIVVGIIVGRSGVKALLRRQIQWRAAPRWYAIALLLLPAVYTGVVVLNVLLGAETPTRDELNDWPSALLAFPFVLVIGGALGEELGFRGFALPRIMAGRSALSASLIVGALVAAWHLPFYRSLNDIAYVPLILAGSILYTWIYNNTNGSILLLTLFHASLGTAAEFYKPMFSGADETRLFWLLAAGVCLTASIVVLMAGPAQLTRRLGVEPTIAGQPATGG